VTTAVIVVAVLATAAVVAWFFVGRGSAVREGQDRTDDSFAPPVYRGYNSPAGPGAESQRPDG
jgi:hypothetical protein